MNIGGGVGGTDLSSRCEVLLSLKAKFPPLLIRFIMTIDGKFKTSEVDLSRYLLKKIRIQNSCGGGWGGGGGAIEWRHFRLERIFSSLYH